MKEIMLSIIIPCFNSGNRLLKYYYSKLSKVDDIEFIIVDDCSTDGSFELLDKNITKPNFRIIKNVNNSGPGYSRNIGIENSSGRYITFLDSDDTFEDDFFNFVKELDNETELYIFDYYVISKKGKKPAKTVLSRKQNGVYSVGDYLVYTRGCPWCKVFLKSIILENNIKFLNQMRNEDMPFVITAISKCKKIKYINKNLYNYVQNPDSLMHNQNLINPQNAINAYAYLKEHVSTNIFRDELEFLHLKHYFYSVSISTLFCMKKKEWKKYVFNRKQEIHFGKDNAYYSSLTKMFRFQLFLINHSFYYTLKAIHAIWNS